MNNDRFDFQMRLPTAHQALAIDDETMELMVLPVDPAAFRFALGAFNAAARGAMPIAPLVNAPANTELVLTVLTANRDASFRLALSGALATLLTPGAQRSEGSPFAYLARLALLPDLYDPDSGFGEYCTDLPGDVIELDSVLVDAAAVGRVDRDGDWLRFNVADVQELIQASIESRQAA
jgi:hypothetical protein